METPGPPVDDFSATAALKRFDPIWYRIREVITPRVIFAGIVAVFGLAVTLSVQLHTLRADVSTVLDEFKTSKAQGEQIAKLTQQVADLDRQVQGQQARWDRIDKNIDAPVPRRKR